MLILTRKPGESLYIGDAVKVTLVEIKGNQARLGIDAPPEIRIYREEIYVQILEENKTAAEAALAPESGLEGLSEAFGGVPSDAGRAGPPSPMLTTALRGTKARAHGGGKRGEGGPEVVVRRKGGKKPNE